ncbi:MAG: hypothetical protein NWR21_07540 [Verrucomicrobiales bacterium]|jgi:hypothetical protein|nr:hypothetical protein [Verrucomicrobiales bacterium]MDP4791873.1 hypothetical protein [Verrucomicrobiales bacterium]MDP4939149.1 hypothetical protein [Verrucomicrobiales bacterium]MDP5005119.1 hypothetical protein [Verrucomicrobiales bacterium]
MSLNHSKGRLTGLSRDLLRIWQETQESWRDQKGREFDSAYMQPMFDAVDHATTAIEDLDKVLKKLKDDCEI